MIWIITKRSGGDANYQFDDGLGQDALDVDAANAECARLIAENIAEVDAYNANVTDPDNLMQYATFSMEPLG